MLTPHQSESPFDISFIIPACNEAELIGSTVQSIQTAMEGQLDQQRYQIIVADDDSKDTTAAIARENHADVVIVQGRNIAAARNAGYQASSGMRLIFVDADTRVDEKLVRETIDAFSGVATWGTAIVAPADRCPLWARFLGVFFNFYYIRIRKCAYGCYFFVTREAYESAGGFPEDADEGEDMALSKLLTKQNGTLHVLRNRVHSSARKAWEFGFWFHMRMLWLSFRYGDAMCRHPEVTQYYDGDRRLE